MPSRMIHYLVAEEVGKRIPIQDMNRFKIGSLCPDMSSETMIVKIYRIIKRLPGI